MEERTRLVPTSGHPGHHRGDHRMDKDENRNGEGEYPALKGQGMEYLDVLVTRRDVNGGVDICHLVHDADREEEHQCHKDCDPVKESYHGGS